MYGLGVAWFDMDDDGRLDLIVANDSGPNHVYSNLGNGRFRDVSYPSGAALEGNGREQAHMGVAIGDYDNDGRDDIHITNFADDFNVLYRNEDGHSFDDVSFKTGIARVSLPFLGWGTSFLDYDNDGWLDLLVVNGHVYPSVDTLPWNTTYAQRALLLRNLTGRTFVDVGAAAGALTVPHVSRGLAVGDLDDDGGLDVIANNLDGAPTAGSQRWPSRALVDGARFVAIPRRSVPGTRSDRSCSSPPADRRVRGEVASGRSQISQSDLRVHVGARRRRRNREARGAVGERPNRRVPDRACGLDRDD